MEEPIRGWQGGPSHYHYELVRTGPESVVGRVRSGLRVLFETEPSEDEDGAAAAVEAWRKAHGEMPP